MWRVGQDVRRTACEVEGQQEGKKGGRDGG